MFDKVTFKTQINMCTASTIVKRNKLVENKKDGSFSSYESSAFGNFEGLFIKIDKQYRMYVTCSMHALYYKLSHGYLDNSRAFTMSQALLTINKLFERIGVDMMQMKVVYYEIGLNLPLQRGPDEYINLAQSIDGKTLYIDANFPENRQKTTEKSRTKKKIFKIYDKTFEYRDKRKLVDDGILRIETMYRKQDITMSEFVSPEFIARLTNRFYTDWRSVTFPQTIKAEKGLKQSQIERCIKILSMGVDNYLNYTNDLFASGEMTKIQLQDARAFARNWEGMKSKVKLTECIQEQEYREKLGETLKICSE